MTKDFHQSPLVGWAGLTTPATGLNPWDPTRSTKHPAISLPFLSSSFFLCAALRPFSPCCPSIHDFGLFSDDRRASAEAQSELIADVLPFPKLLGALSFGVGHLLPCEPSKWAREERGAATVHYFLASFRHSACPDLVSNPIYTIIIKRQFELKLGVSPTSDRDTLVDNCRNVTMIAN